MITTIVGVQGTTEEPETKGVYILNITDLKRAYSLHKVPAFSSDKRKNPADIFLEDSVTSGVAESAQSDRYRTPLSFKSLMKSGPWVATSILGIHGMDIEKRTQKVIITFADLHQKLKSFKQKGAHTFSRQEQESLDALIDAGFPRFMANKDRVAFVTPYSASEFLLSLLVGNEYQAPSRPSPTFVYESVALLHVRFRNDSGNVTVDDVNLLNANTNGYIKKRENGAAPLLYIPYQNSILVRKLSSGTSGSSSVSLVDAGEYYTFKYHESLVTSFDVANNFIGAILENPQKGTYNFVLQSRDGKSHAELGIDDITRPPKSLRLVQEGDALYCYIGCYGGTIITARYHLDNGMISEMHDKITRNCFLTYDEIYDMPDGEDHKFSVKRITANISDRLLFCFSNYIYNIPRALLMENNIFYVDYPASGSLSGITDPDTDAFLNLTSNGVVFVDLPHRITTFSEGVEK